MPLLTSLFACCLATQAATGNPTTLARTFTKNEKLAYQVRSHLTAESRSGMVQTWVPEDIDINYNFTTYVEQLRPEGIAVLRYERPSITEIQGETFNAGPKTKTEKINWVIRATVSPINELISVTDLTKKKATAKSLSGNWRASSSAPLQVPVFGEFIQEVHRLALFVGGLDSAMDFAPRLPLQPVKVGDTWKRTVGYAPQRLKGKDGKSAVQRLDYTYTYLGPRQNNGRKTLHVQAKLNFSTDLADFLKQLLEENFDQTGLKSFPLKLDATIDYDLDPVSKTTLYAEATSDGGYQILLNDRDEAVSEERFKGRTVLELVGHKILPPSAAVRR